MVLSSYEIHTENRKNSATIRCWPCVAEWEGGMSASCTAASYKYYSYKQRYRECTSDLTFTTYYT